MSAQLDELLTADELAALYKVTRRQVLDVVVKAPGFPPIAPGTTRKKPRWLRTEVRRFLSRGPHAVDKRAG